MKIITYNTQWFKGLDDIVDIARIVDVAREMGDFDVICMQEVAINYKELTGDTAPDQPAALAKLLPGFQVFFDPAVDELSPCGTYRQQFGNLIATRMVVRQVQHVALPSPNPPPSTPGEQAVLSMPRSALVLTIDAPWGPVRIMTSHLEYYSYPARYAQAIALRDWHRQCSALAVNPPEVLPGTPYQAKAHTLDTIICGDFNFEEHSPEHSAMIETGSGFDLINSWNILHSDVAYPATFRLFDRTYGPEPVGCDFFFVSASLKHRVRQLSVNQLTQASDHQPVLLELF
jgi:endonuclease/exonuclease/phosphatase family metal-dependent hydrolase